MGGPSDLSFCSGGHSIGVSAFLDNREASTLSSASSFSPALVRGSTASAAGGGGFSASQESSRGASQVSPGFYEHLFCVPKASGGWGPVLDLSFLNRFLRRVKFRMETNSSIRESIRQNDWGASIDLTDAYFHIPIHPRDRKWLRFVWEGQVFQFCALPFGLSLAPWIFTKVSRELCSSLHLKGLRVQMFLDDWLSWPSPKNRAFSRFSPFWVRSGRWGSFPTWGSQIWFPPRSSLTWE